MSITTWLWGSSLVVSLVAPAGWAAWRVRRRSLAEWEGAPARLAESIIALATILTVCQVLGAVGLFNRGVVIPAVFVVALGLGSWATAPTAVSPPASTPEDRGGWAGSLAAVTAVAIVVGQWSTFTVESLRGGVLAADSIWYHLPRAARFVQTGWLTRLHYTVPEFPDTFHPANGELVQALPMLMYERDVLSAVINLGWLALLLLAAWCIGQPYGRGSLALTGAAAVLATPLLVVEGAGNAGNDIAAAFFLLAAAALLLQPNGGRAAVALAGLAAGLAISTKLTVVPAVLALSVGVVCTGKVGERARRSAAWSLPLIVTGSYWYVRNWLMVGSPLPATHLPLFPARRFRIADELGFSVFDYLTDIPVWRQWFLPGLRYDFGLAWPVVLLLLAVACGGALRKGQAGLTRTLGATLAVATTAYLLLPTTALGEPGAPTLFAGNVIYLAPALLLGVAVLPALCSPDRPRSSAALLCAYLIVLVVGSSTSDISTWASGWADVGLGVAAAVWLIALWVVRSHADRWVLVPVGAAASLALLVGLFALGDHGASHRYTDRPFYRWANELTDTRIAVAGFGLQFPFYGVQLDNLVQYVGERGAHGEFHDVRSCSVWRERLRRDRFEYVVLRADLPHTDERQLVWTRSDPAATLWLEAEGGSVFRFDPSVADPGCP